MPNVLNGSRNEPFGFWVWLFGGREPLLRVESFCNFPQLIRGVAKLSLQARFSVVVMCRVDRQAIKTEWTVHDVTPLRTG